jgi:hypothetical protein
MGFHVEIVFKLGVVNNDSSYKSHIESLLEKYKISDFYFFNESDYFNNNWHHICVYDITFENNDKSDIHNMIHFFKKLVFLPHIRVEVIYDDTCKNGLLFTSKQYQNKNNHKKNKVNNNRIRSYSETEFMLLKCVEKINKQKIISAPATYEDYIQLISMRPINK